MKILIVTATEAEMKALSSTTGHTGTSPGRKVELSTLVTGVGSVSTAWQLTRWIHTNGSPDLIINAGIAGSFNPEIEIGSVVMVGSERFADFGVMTESGILTPEEAGLLGFDISGGVIECAGKFAETSRKEFRAVSAVTVGAVTGTPLSAKMLIEKFNPDIETMEGASFFYICTGERVPFLALRSISNMVGIRDKSKWNFSLALKKLGEGLEKLLLILD